MTNIEKMAREAGFAPYTIGVIGGSRAPKLDACIAGEYNVGKELEALVQAVAQRCAEICGAQEDYAVDVLICEASRRSAADCADAIRAEFGVADETTPLKELERIERDTAQRCAEICEATTERGSLDLGGETPAYASSAAIRAEFGLKEKP